MKNGPPHQSLQLLDFRTIHSSRSSSALSPASALHGPAERKHLKFAVENDLALLSEGVASEEPFGNPHTHLMCSATVDGLVAAYPRMNSLMASKDGHFPAIFSPW